MKRILFALLAWVVAAVVFYLLGSLLGLIDPVADVGAWLQDHAGLLGFLVGVWYFIWGHDDTNF